MTQNLGNLFIDGESFPIEDTSGNNHVLTNTSVSRSTTDPIFGEASLYLNGSSYLSAPHSNDWVLGADNFSIDFWVNFTAIGQEGLMMHHALNGYTGWEVQFSPASNKLWFQCMVGGARRLTGMDDFIPDIGTWYHIAIVRDGSDIYIFLDGVSMAITKLFYTGDLGTIDSYTGPLDTGRATGSGGSWYGSYLYASAYMDNVRITKGEALWIENFTTDGESLFYESGVKIPTSTIYNTKQTKMRGKALEGFFRPTISQFFTSMDYVEILAGIIFEAFDTLDTDLWRPFIPGTGSVTADGTLNIVGGSTTETAGAGIISKGVIKGDFEFEVDFDASNFAENFNGQSMGLILSNHDAFVASDQGVYTEPESEDALALYFYENQFGSHWLYTNYSTDPAVHIDYPSIWNAIGKFKVIRTGPSIELWYKTEGTLVGPWTLATTKTSLGLGDLYLTFTKGAWNTFPAHVGKFDNLTFNVGRLGY